MIVTELGYVVLISIDFYDLFIRFSFLLRRSLKAVFETHFQIPRTSSKLLSFVWYIQLFSVFGNVVNYSFSCLIYYVNIIRLLFY